MTSASGLAGGDAVNTDEDAARGDGESWEAD
jgi:hypothetical protein